MECDRRLILILLAAAAAIPVVLTSRRSPHTRAPAAFFAAPSVQGFVRISGDVRQPGMYPLSANKLTCNVIEMAMPVQPISMLEPPGVGALPVSDGEALQ